MNSAKCGYFDLNRSPRQMRAILTIRGPDAPRFLQGLLSADIHRIDQDTAVAACLLTAKGKIVSEVIVVAGDSAYSLIIPHEIAPQTIAMLQRFIIMDDVELIEEPEQHLTWFNADPRESHLQANELWDRLRIVRTRHPAPGYLVWGAMEHIQKLEQLDLVQIPAMTWQRMRIKSDSPEWGREIVADRFPPECGFVDSVSYKKGCFIGQEPLARIHARGQVNWVLVRVQSDYRPSIGESHPREGGSPIPLSSATREQAGHWTSWAYDDNDQEQTIGLAIIHRSLASKGTALSLIDFPDITVTVQSDPLGDDPGIQKA